MRIALVATGGFDRSGRERVIPSLVALVSRLARRHDVVVYVLRYHDAPVSYELAGATVHDLGRPGGIVNQVRAVMRALRADGRCDVIHGYWAHPAGLVAALVGRWCGIPSVVTCDSGEFVSIRDIGYGLQRTLRTRLAVKMATRTAGRVTVASRYQQDLAARHGVAADIIPLGVDLAIFGEMPAPVRHTPIRLLTVASINRVKDHRTLVDAVRILADEHVDVSADIVGEDTLGGEVQQHARAQGVESRVRFHGFLPTDKLIPLYADADLFVLPSRHEAAGVVLLEAAACGLPIVGSRVGYIADWTPGMALGVAPRDAAALAGAIRALADDARRRSTMAAAARAWVEAHDADWTADRFEQLYDELITASHSQPRQARR